MKSSCVFGRRAGQRGAATLVMVLAVLVLLTVVTVMSGRIATVEQRTAANEVRARQAFEGAMTGYEHALACAANPLLLDANNQPFCPPPAPNANPATRAAAPGGGTYAAELCNPLLFDPATSAADPTAACAPGAGAGRILVYARGWSDDGTGVHHVTALAKAVPAMAGTPGVPVTARGAAFSNGSADIINPCGRSTIWSGQAFTPTNANYKTNILSPTGVGYIESSSSRQIGVDVVANDGNLSQLSGDRFFQNFMGLLPADYRAAVAPTIVTDDLSNHEGEESENAVLWVADPDRTDDVVPTFKISGNAVFGQLPENLDPCEIDLTADVRPSVIIIEGNLDATGTPVFNGLLYVKGNLEGSGTITVNGAVIIEGSVNNMTGSLDVIFNPLLLTRAQNLGRAAVLPGSWSDWL